MMAASLVAAAQELPDGKGKEQVIKICSDCHEIGTVIGSRNTRIGWQRTVEDMVSRGAEGSEEDMAAVVDYLTRFFGKINVNTASAKEIQSFLGLPDKEAQAIVTYRERNGNFKGFEQLTQVPGVDGAKLQAKRSLIAFSL
ncbi:MAG TPA: helix-hairpin-helix domain-containing protein [Candidatus Sulfopaludibacter sp.]|nr:helix-hairpin-helix domain-containing protein [Candidatus Sulfopaludibacter sp.]